MITAVMIVVNGNLIFPKGTQLGESVTTKPIGSLATVTPKTFSDVSFAEGVRCTQQKV
jgi:hypothetical protein